MYTGVFDRSENYYQIASILLPIPTGIHTRTRVFSNLLIKIPWFYIINMPIYDQYKAFGDQTKIEYSTCVVTRRAIISLLPGLSDKEGNNIIIARQ